MIEANNPRLCDFERACIEMRGDNTAKSDEVMLTECALGLCEEVSEVACALDGRSGGRLISELGDVCWYVTTSAHRLDMTLADVRAYASGVSDDEDDPDREMAIYAGSYAGMLKKHLHYGVPLNREHVGRHFATILDCVEILADSFGFTLEDAFNANVEKNRKRFPSGGFTAAEARARVDLR